MGGDLGGRLMFEAIVTAVKDLREKKEHHDREGKKEAVYREIGNVLYQWEQLPNDIRTDPGFESLGFVLVELRNSVKSR